MIPGASPASQQQNTPASGSQIARQTYSSLEEQANWGSCVSCAGGANNAGTIATELATQPSRSGQSRHFSIEGIQNTDALWWYKVGANDEVSNFVFDFWLNVGSTTDKAQALEFDTFQFDKGVEYMFGTQCDYGSGTWDVWNVAHWAHTAVPCAPFQPGQWYHVVWNFHRTPDGNQHYDTLAINDTVYQVNVTYPSGPLPAGWSDNLGVQFQMDIGPESASIEEWVDQVTLTVW